MAAIQSTGKRAPIKLPAAIPGRNGFKYKPQFGLVIVCNDEKQQSALFQQFTREGHTVRVVCV